jgi:hypothetical protein
MYCNKYRGMSLLPSTCKILSIIFVSRITPYIDKIIGDHHCGFQHNRSTVDQIFYVRQIPEKKWVYNRTVHQLFTDFEKTHDSVRSIEQYSH